MKAIPGEIASIKSQASMGASVKIFDDRFGWEINWRDRISLASSDEGPAFIVSVIDNWGHGRIAYVLTTDRIGWINELSLEQLPSRDIP